MDVSPESRFADTAYLIFGQWRQSGEHFSFPTVYHFFHPNEDDQSTLKRKKIFTFKIKDANRKSTGATPKRRKNRKSVELKVIEDDEDDDTSHEDTIEKDDKTVQTVNLNEDNNLGDKHSSVISDDALDVQTNIEVSVDFHHRPNSEVESIVTIEANNNDIKYIDEQLETESVKTLTEESAPVTRKVYNRNINDYTTDTSEYDTSSIDDLDSVDYCDVVYRKKNNHGEKQQQQQIIPKYNSLPITSHQKTTPKQSANLIIHHDALRISYITERILASILPPRMNPVNGCNSGYDEHEKELISMLEQKHGRNYQMFDLESCISTITLEKLCELCKHIDAWLGSGREKIVVLQDREDKQRLGAAIEAYLEYQKICGSNFPQVKSVQTLDDRRIQSKINRNWLDLDIFSMRKFVENSIGPLKIPSHRRYIEYFSGLLAGTIKMNSAPIYLRAIILESPPCLHYKAITLNNEWRSFVKVFEGQRCLFTSNIYVIPISTRQFIYEIKHPIRLRGDVLIQCYQIIPNNNQICDEKELISSVQFHTCAITDKEVQFSRNDLDFACDDERFSTEHKFTLQFENTPNGVNNERNHILVFQNPLVRMEPIIEDGDINEDDSNQIQGPIDGSLYATILKSPRSPTSSSFQLISPPAEFSNSKSILDKPKTPSSSEKYYTYSSAKNLTSFKSPVNRDSSNKSINLETHYAIVENGASDGRTSVRSPLTLSMDSGISSSGVVNRRHQASSASPCSFPSQASPQEDRHRELDDLLSDMLMTVQDIPDFGKLSLQQQNKQINHHQKSLPSARLAYDQHNNSENSIKRSQSAQLAITSTPIREETTTTTSTDRDLMLYETSSTTTTLTPPPSESGDRDTPRRELNQQQTAAERELILNLQHQSFAYPRSVRSTTTTASERFTSEDEDDNISLPYHAREDSRPFTYGTIPTTGPQNPPASIMIKMQSGLSSPSMVRKALGGTPQSVRKNQTRDFEEMLRERRDKNYPEKYTIGDKTPNGDYNSATVNNSDSDKWNYTITKTTTTSSSNGYQTPEPLKRSNTMDGSFGRSFSNDGLSGQSWLQLQQQKLRAKKEMQKREHSNSFSYSYGSPSSFPSSESIYHTTNHRRSQTASPVRNERNYSTITTTKQTVSNERPFVAVKRAHENAKQQSIGSPNAPLNVLNASPNGHIAHAQITNHSSQNGLLSFADELDTSTTNGHARLAREESFSSYRSETEADNSPTGGSPRPETPAFPVTPRTPSYGVNTTITTTSSSSPALPPKSPTSQRKDLYTGRTTQEVVNQNETVSCYTSRRNSTTSNANSEPQEVAPQFVKFAHDSSKYWYKPTLSREDAVALLRNAAPGTFVVRDSTTFANAYGLVVKVAHPPPGVQSKGPNSDELVRHFLVEPTIRGVRLKGCSNEPVFTSLSALVYQHSSTPLALPCRLIIPDHDLQQIDYPTPAQQQLLMQGAACNVLYLFTCDTESLTGPQAVRKAVSALFSRRPLPKSTQVHLKVSNQGVTLTDNTRQLFFRRHYPSNTVSHCGLDPDDHRWSVPATSGEIPVTNNRIFAYVAKRSPSSADNQCHVFCELEPTQPATAIVSFTNKIILGGNVQQQTLPRAI